MEAWEVFVLLFAFYIAIMSLIRLMRQRRDTLVADMRRQIEEERQRREAEEHQKRMKTRREKNAA